MDPILAVILGAIWICSCGWVYCQGYLNGMDFTRRLWLEDRSDWEEIRSELTKARES